MPDHAIESQVKLKKMNQLFTAFYKNNLPPSASNHNTQWLAQEFSKVQGITLRGACLLMGDGHHKLATGLYSAFLHAELHSKVSGAHVDRMLIYVCVKCCHGSLVSENLPVWVGDDTQWWIIFHLSSLIL